MDDEWSYDFENDIDSDEEHVDSIQWCATFSSHGVGLDVGLNRGGDLDVNLDHGIGGLEVGLDHGTSGLDIGFDDGGALDHDDALDHGVIAHDDALDHDAIAHDDALDHGATDPSKSKGDLQNIDNPKLLVLNLKLIIANLNLGLSPHKILGKTLASINFDLDNESILKPLEIFLQPLMHHLCQLEPRFLSMHWCLNLASKKMP